MKVRVRFEQTIEYAATIEVDTEAYLTWQAGPGTWAVDRLAEFLRSGKDGELGQLEGELIAKADDGDVLEFRIIAAEPLNGCHSSYDPPYLAAFTRSFRETP